MYWGTESNTKYEQIEAEESTWCVPREQEDDDGRETGYSYNR